MNRYFSYMVMITFIMLRSSVVTGAAQPISVPERILSGDYSVLKLLSQVRSYTITISSDSAEIDYVKLGFFQDHFDSIKELEKKLTRFMPELKISNPNDEIKIDVSLSDSAWEELFQGSSSFRLEKVYDKDGNVSYQKPSHAGLVYLRAIESATDFPGVGIKQDWLEDKSGNKRQLDIYDANKWMRPESSSSYIFVFAKTKESQFRHDLVTGQLLPAVSQNVSVEEIRIEGIDSIYDEDIHLTLSPEYGYCPWIEVNVKAGQAIGINVRSQYGYRPIAVRSVTLGELNQGIEPQFHPYKDSMLIEADTDTFYLFFQFPPRTYQNHYRNGN